MRTPASRALYRGLARLVGAAAASPSGGAVRWVAWAGDEAPVRIGFDPSIGRPLQRLAQRLDRAGAAGLVRWIACERVPRAHGWLRPQNLDRGGGRGTLGAVVRARTPDARLFGVTAGHVLAADPAARAGDAVRLQQAFPPLAIEGRLWTWSPDLGERGRDASFDAALMHLPAQALESVVDDIAWPTGWAEAAPGERVFLLSRHQHLPARIAGRINTLVEAGEPPQRYVLRDVLCYDADTAPLGGDSGAAIWDERERLVALHVGEAPAGCGGNGVASPIGRVLDWCGCDLVLRNEPLTREDRAAAVPVAVRPDPPVPPGSEDARAIDILARTMWGEARGERDAEAAMRAVAHVVLNRRDRPGWWGRSVEGVCVRPFQFSCWNENDPNRPKLLAVGRADGSFQRALAIAQELVRQPPMERARADTTGGATHYHARSIAPPPWTARATLTARIGNHLFYRDVA